MRSLTKTLSAQVVRSSMDTGAAKVRRRFTARVEPVSCEMILSGTQLALLRTFFLDTIAGGAEAFDFKDPETGVTGTFRFTSPPTFTPLAPRRAGATEYWKTQLALESLPVSSAPVVLPGGTEAPLVEVFGFTGPLLTELLPDDGAFGVTAVPIDTPDLVFDDGYLFLMPPNGQDLVGIDAADLAPVCGTVAISVPGRTIIPGPTGDGEGVVPNTDETGQTGGGGITVGGGEIFGVVCS